ncbi:hypothetical protein JAAARDRAFT_207691 [Jaapia argillacea MUCL 33604]|uniref:Nephrocystin 3-like N-terminal domain-containing protein n=1 Tax=Jaapia argillacea MUCL 33604 TaxID=933084 RepID=A0A067PP47_9AGAM|nr:hypothetical protein JAAARDRAFT_207691 [Jaapia argillacea MUCL 33604]
MLVCANACHCTCVCGGILKSNSFQDFAYTCDGTPHLYGTVLCHYHWEISEWISGENPSPIFWVRSPYDTPMSTIAHDIASNLDKEGDQLGVKLAGSWFPQKNANDSMTTKFFPTIAHQMSISMPYIQEGLARDLATDPSLVHQTPDRQFEKLILNQIRPFGKSIPTPVVVINGLDECDGMNAEALMQAIVGAYAADPDGPRIRFIITSCPDNQVLQRLLDSNPSMIHTLNL